MKALLDTYLPLGRNERGDEIGELTVIIRGQPTQVRCYRTDYGMYLAGFVGRYVTSTKPWNAHVRLQSDGHISVNFGRDDRSGRFNKSNMISYEPRLWATLANLKMWGLGE